MGTSLDRQKGLHKKNNALVRSAAAGRLTVPDRFTVKLGVRDLDEGENEQQNDQRSKRKGAPPRLRASPEESGKGNHARADHVDDDQPRKTEPSRSFPSALDERRPRKSDQDRAKQTRPEAAGRGGEPKDFDRREGKQHQRCSAGELEKCFEPEKLVHRRPIRSTGEGWPRTSLGFKPSTRETRPGSAYLPAFEACFSHQSPEPKLSLDELEPPSNQPLKKPSSFFFCAISRLGS